MYTNIYAYRLFIYSTYLADIYTHLHPRTKEMHMRTRIYPHNPHTHSHTHFHTPHTHTYTHILIHPPSYSPPSATVTVSSAYNSECAGNTVGLVTTLGSFIHPPLALPEGSTTTRTLWRTTPPLIDTGRLLGKVCGEFSAVTVTVSDTRVWPPLWGSRHTDGIDASSNSNTADPIPRNTLRVALPIGWVKTGGGTSAASGGEGMSCQNRWVKE